MKAVLAQRYSVKGRFYGPGEVDIDEATHAALARRGAFTHPLADFPQLILAGYKTIEEARLMDDSVLLKIDGVGPATIKKLRGETEESVPKFIGEKSSGAEKKRAN